MDIAPLLLDAPHGCEYCGTPTPYVYCVSCCEQHDNRYHSVTQ